ncbi:transcription cofactor vestigial-like protein 1 [Psammomys obesus]|uniref:transcription cofactor vestigial-like protein 1 n=1 Tax=Psammomys obesus TaxID=48139 RepID=UPI002452C41F|nr:transcription cofactor vestigial-like protein 1 [Psammomys obesus]
MEETKKFGVRIPKRRQKPRRTEWNSRCVLFTYFQGDINSMVDEHFTRALRNLKKPPGWSFSSHSENLILRNAQTFSEHLRHMYEICKASPDGNGPVVRGEATSSQIEHSGELKEVPMKVKGTNSSMAPNQWHLSSWTNPRPEASPANDFSSSSSSDEYSPTAMALHPLSMPSAPSAHMQELWQVSSLVRPEFLEPTFPVFPDRHLAPEVYFDGYHESRLYLLHRDRYLNHPLQPAVRENYNLARIVGSTGLLLNLPPSTDYCKKLFTDTCKVTAVDNNKIYGLAPATASLDNERSLSPENRRDLYFY